MAIKRRSAKNKGSQFQKKIAEDLLKVFPEINPEEVIPAPASIPGEDLILSENARAKLNNTNFELKRQETVSIWAWLEQAAEEANKHDSNPVVVFKRNHSKVYATIEFAFLTELLLTAKKYRDLKQSQNLDVDKLKSMFTSEFLDSLTHPPTEK